MKIDLVTELAAKQAEIERLRSALDIIGYDPPGYDECIEIARKALDYGLPTAADVRGILKSNTHG